MPKDSGGLIKGMFFDLDGTLCDTDEANFLAYKRAFKDEGFNFSKQEFNSVNGQRADKFIPIVVPGISNQQVLAIRKRKAKYYPEYMSITKPNNQLIAFLNLIRTSHTTVLLTTAKRINAEHVIRQSQLTGCFDLMIFGDEVENPKPNPEVYLTALKKTGLKPAEVIAFEDSSSGINAAVSAGLKVIKVEL